jgi:hypothetical protein
MEVAVSAVCVSGCSVVEVLSLGLQVVNVYVVSSDVKVRAGAESNLDIMFETRI